MKKLKQILIFLFLTLNIFMFKVNADNEIISPQNILITDDEYFLQDSENPELYLGKKKFANSNLSEKNLEDIKNYNSNFFVGDSDEWMYYNINLSGSVVDNLKIFDFNGNEMTGVYIEGNNIKLYYDSFFDKILINDWQSKRVFKYGSGYVFEPKNIKLTFNQDGSNKEVNFLFKFNIPKYDILNEIKYKNIKLNDDDEIKINFPNGFLSGVAIDFPYGGDYEETRQDNLFIFNIVDKDKLWNDIDIFFYNDYDFYLLSFGGYNYFSDSFCEGNSKIYLDISSNGYSQDYNEFRNSNKIISSKLKIEKFNSGSNTFELVDLPGGGLDFPQNTKLDLLNKLDILDNGIYRFSVTDTKDLYTELGCDKNETKIVYPLDSKGEIFVKEKNISQLEEDEVDFENLFTQYTLSLKDIIGYQDYYSQYDYNYFLNTDFFDITKDFSFYVKTNSGNIIYSGGINCLNPENIDGDGNQYCGIGLENSLISYFSQTGSEIENLNFEAYYEDIYGYNDLFIDKSFTDKIIYGISEEKDSIIFINKSLDDEENIYNYNFTYIPGQDNVLDINNKPFIINAKTNSGENIEINEGDISSSGSYWYTVDYNYNDSCDWECDINLFINKNIDIKEIKIIFNDGRVFLYNFNNSINNSESGVKEKKGDSGDNSKINILYSSLNKPFDNLLFVSKYSFNYYDDNNTEILNNTAERSYHYDINDILITGTGVNNINKKNIYVCKKYFTSDIDVKKYCSNSLINKYNIGEDLYIYGYDNLANKDYTSLSIKILFEFWSIYTAQ
ncbi:hypothetical protein H3C61_01845 [Candidatus Gracilibacteria bacterium]|nr:hypothetical protein [Candidatus Gracilibacteria bacterium]